MWREAFVWTAVVVGAGAAAAQIPPSPWPSAPPAPAPFNPGSLGPTSGPLGSFVPAQPGAPPRAAEPARPFEEQLTPFDWRLTDLRWGEQGWQLVAGDVVLKDFGRREHDGTEALRIIRELRLNQRGTVGSPRPIMEYWLSDGQAPQGPVSGARTLPIDRNTLRVEKVLGHWWLRDSARGYFNFGIHEDDARQALAVMQHHRFSRVALVGQALPLMLIFLAEPDAATPSPLHGPAPLHAPGWPPAAGPAPAGTLPQAGLCPSQMMQPGVPATPQMPAGFAPGALAPAGFPVGRQMGLPGGALPGLGSLATQVPLDVFQSRLDRDAQGWKLVCGGYVVGRFGNNYPDAQMALSALHYYRFTQHCLIGKDKPVFSFFLVNGQAPHGAMLGAQGVSFHPESAVLRQAGKVWEITDRGQVLFRFGDKGEEARQAMQAIQRYKFDTIYRIGQPEAGGMVVLARTR